MQEKVHYLTTPIVARYVRVHPVTWRGKIAMRVGLLGCRHKGPCGPGFFRVNGKSSCGKKFLAILSLLPISIYQVDECD